jgi:hypothetical protein
MLNKATKLKLKYKIGLGSMSVILMTTLLIAAFPEASYKNSQVKGNSGISRHIEPINYNRGNLDKLPLYNKDSDQNFQVDLRSTDVSNLDLSDKKDDLMYADFDSKTKWPNLLPKEFNTQTIMDYGKNPGLNLNKLHEKGITGKGVGIAIIDQVLLTDHVEYKDRLKFYEEIHAQDETSMHGAAVASIAVGKNVGVAPEADLYYIAVAPSTFNSKHEMSMDFTYEAKAINRILEINQTLSNDKKIRVISMSIGWQKDLKGVNELDEAIKMAQEQNILVVSSNLNQYYPFNFNGLGRDPLSNPDDINNYIPGIFWQKHFYNDYQFFEKNINNTLMVPMDSRCTASPTGTSDYVFYRNGGASWSIPYISGLYALSCQVNPDITPEIFFKEAISTGSIIDIEKDSHQYKLGTVVNAEKLIKKLQ